MLQNVSQISYEAILEANLKNDGLACWHLWGTCHWLVLWDECIQTLTDLDSVHSEITTALSSC